MSALFRGGYRNLLSEQPVLFSKWKGQGMRHRMRDRLLQNCGVLQYGDEHMLYWRWLFVITQERRP